MSVGCHQNDRPSLHVHLAHRTHACITHRTTPRSGIRVAVSVWRADWPIALAAVSLRRGACGAGALQAGRKSSGLIPRGTVSAAAGSAHFPPDRRSRRVFRDVFTIYHSYIWEVSCLLKLCSPI